MTRLNFIKKKHSGRMRNGAISVRHKGGEHKRFIRTIDFKRDKLGIKGKVIAFEYDPNRTCDIALISYADGDKRYILKPEGLGLNDTVVAGSNAEVKIGSSLPLNILPLGTVVHNIELTPGKGGQLARSAGTSAVIQAREGNLVHIKLPSGEIRKIRGEGFATVGQLGNIEWKNEFFAHAGRRRHMGIRPTVRGVAQNPRSHPHGGGEGRSGIGMASPKTYTGRKAVGKTRRVNKYSNKYILQRRKK